MESSRTELTLPEPYDLAGTIWLAGMGSRDPTFHFSQTHASLAFHTPEGPCSVLAERTDVGDLALSVECIGPGRHFLEPRLEKLFGLHDQPGQFQPEGRLGRLVRERPGLHLPTLPVVFGRLVQIVLQQLVVWSDALRGWLELTKRYGEVAPCGELRLGPTPARLAELGYYDIVDCGVMPKQARLILQLAREAKRIERLAAESPEALANYLRSIRGIGEWTVGHLMGTTLGDADAILPGDYGLPHSVAWALIGKERSDDEEMLRLLEPYAGHRFRVVNLVWQSGIEAPRRGPKSRTNRWRFAKR